MRVLGIDFVVCSIPSGNMEEAVSFYRDTLGVTDELIMGDGKADTWTEFDTHPVALALGKWKTPGIAVALAVDDVAKAAEELRAKGVKILYGPQEFPDCYMAAIEDPWGNMFMIHQRKDGTVG